MKKSKIIIPALAMLVMSTAATVTGTVAWFTMNKTAKAQNMVVSAKTSGSLIIKEAAASTPSLPNGTERGTKVTFNEGAKEFYPSTHVSYNAIGDAFPSGNSTGLVYVQNGAEINFETGTRMNNTVTLDMQPVPASTASAYYYDYGVFLAGDGLTMPNQTLSITLDNTAVTDDLDGALSIDFYGEQVSSAQRAAVSGANYLGTINLAKMKNTGVGAVTDTGVDTVTKSGITIPKSDPDTPGAYAITMRVYFDGALIQNGIANNDYAVYTLNGDTAYDADILYYSDAQGSQIVNVKSTDNISNLYTVDTTASTLCFARSINVAQISQHILNVTFTAQ